MNESQMANATDALHGPPNPQASDETPQDASCNFLVTEAEGSSSKRQHQVSQEKTSKQSEGSATRKAPTSSSEAEAMNCPTSEGEAATGQRAGSPRHQPAPALAQDDSDPDLTPGPNVQLSVSMSPDLGQGEGSPGNCNHLTPRASGEVLEAIADGSGGQSSQPGSSLQAYGVEEPEMEGIRLSHEIPVNEVRKADKDCCDPARQIKKLTQGCYTIAPTMINGSDKVFPKPYALFWNQLLKRTTVFLVGASNAVHLGGLIKSMLVTQSPRADSLRAICLQLEENAVVGERDLIQQLHKEKQEGYSTLVIYLDLEGHSLLNTSHQMGHLHVDQHAEPLRHHLRSLALRVVGLIRNVSQHATYSLYLPPLPRMGQENCAACVDPADYINALNSYDRQLNKAMKSTLFRGFASMSRWLYLKWIIELLSPNLKGWVIIYGMDYFNTKLQQICGDSELQMLWFLPRPLEASEEHDIRVRALGQLHHGLLRVDGVHYQHSTLEAIWVLCSSVIQANIDKGRYPNLEYTRPVLGNPSLWLERKAERIIAQKDRREKLFG